jgi:hypothetical protein
MIYRHKRSGGLYRLLIDSFSVERQANSMVYVSLETGQVFDRDSKRFAENFEYVSDAQAGIVPKAPHA